MVLGSSWESMSLPFFIKALPDSVGLFYFCTLMKSPALLLSVLLISFCGYAQQDSLNEQVSVEDSLGILKWDLISKEKKNSANWYVTLGNPESPGYTLSKITSSLQYPRLMIVDTHNFGLTLTKQPHTDLLYQLGSYTYQRFHLSHRQGIRRNVAAIVNVRRSKTTGAFQRMTSEFTKLRAGVSVISNDSLSQLDVLYNYRRSFVEENGGLEYPSDFESYVFDIPELYSVKLPSASNTYKTNFFQLDGKVCLSSGQTSSFNLDVESKVGRDRSDFNDNSFPFTFYPNIYFDSTSTDDSIVVGWLDNYAGVTLQSKQLRFALGATHYYEDYSQNRKVDTIYHNYGLQTSLRFASSTFEGTLQGRYIVSGYNEGNYFLNALLSTQLDSGVIIHLRGGLQEYTPHMGFLSRRTNNSLWKFTSFRNPIELTASGGISIERALKTKLSFDLQQITNHLYYNENRNLAQYQSSISIFGTSLDLQYTFFKHLKVEPSIRYQAISNTSVLPLPDLLASVNLSYKRPIFKNRLSAEIGTRVWWVNEFTGYNYAPELGAFHVQDSVRSGGYPFVQGYVNLYVKRAVIGVRVNHATEGLLGYDFDLVTGYPAQPRQIALHLRWTLID